MQELPHNLLHFAAHRFTISHMRLYLVLPLSMHKLAKARGAKHDDRKQAWYVDSLAPARAMSAWFDHAAVARIREKGSLAAALKGRTRQSGVSINPRRPDKLHRYYLDVPDIEYNLVAHLGAKWCKGAHKWYVKAASFPAIFNQWRAVSFEARKRRALQKHQQSSPPLCQ